ncbi:MAG: hypothetical protein J5I92_05925 [Thiogranum sp.]|nr:hypothetical protein [Thiogranum sp.]
MDVSTSLGTPSPDQYFRISCHKALTPASFFFLAAYPAAVSTASGGAEMRASLPGSIRRRVVNRSATELASLVVRRHDSFTAERRLSMYQLLVELKMQKRVT